MHLAVMGDPRSECSVSTRGCTPCLRHVSPIKVSGQAGGLALRHHPSGGVAAVDVQDHVQIRSTATSPARGAE